MELHFPSPHARQRRHRLVTLGGLTLLTPDGADDPSLGTRRRKLAVLVYLALRGKPVTRDHLAGLFWGGKDDERARNSLSDALSHLRRVIGRDAIVTRGEEVSLASDAPLEIDARELSAAAEAEDAARVAALYTGAFLDGVHVDDAPEFEQWVSLEGERLRRVFTRACAPLVLALSKNERWDECSDLAARWLAAEPTCTKAALFRLEALSAAGTHEACAAALTEYQRLRTRLADEFGLGVDARVEQLAASIRAALPPLIPAVTVSPSGEDATIAAPVAPTVHHADVRAAPRWRIPVRLGALMAAVAMIAGAAAYGTLRVGGDQPPTLAVLPFENIGNAGDAYFADGLTDEVRVRLAGISGLQVVGGTSARQYKHTTKTSRQIARELGATYLLSGSVRWERTSDGRGSVRVSPELIRAGDQSMVWAESVEGPLDEVFAMQAHVAERVAHALDVTLLAREGHEVTARPTTNLAAYDAYLRGRAGVSNATNFNAADRQATLEEFERAVMLDPNFAAAHSEIAWVHWRNYSQAGNPADAAAALAKFRAAARRGWALDTVRTDTRVAYARLLEVENDWPGAERLMRATARMAPNNVDALSDLGRVEARAGRVEAGIAAYRKAMALDSRSAHSWADLAGLFDRMYRYEDAIAVREHEIEVTPGADVAYAVQASSHLLFRGDTATARRTLERASVALPWIVRLPGGVAGINIWQHVLPAAVLRARDTLTLVGYLAGAGGIAPELYHLLKLRHLLQSGHADLARAHADSLVRMIEPAVRSSGDAPWFFWWFSRRSLLAEAYAMLGRNADAARMTDDYVAETRRRRLTTPYRDPERLCHALHNAAYVDASIGRKDVAVARLTEALALPCGHRVSRALLRVEPAWATLRGNTGFDRLVAGNAGP